MSTPRSIWPVGDTPSDDISIYEGPEQFLEDLASSSKVDQVLFCAYWLQAEVLNGGLNQFFDNDTGVLAPEAAEACETLGLPLLAAKVREAMEFFGPVYPRDREVRQAALAGNADNSNDDPFATLDDEVAALIYDEGPGLERAAIAYVNSNR